MIRAHADAVIAALRAVSNLTVYDAEVPDEPTLPYTVVYSDQGAATSTRLTQTSDMRVFRFPITAVGGDRAQAQWAAEKVESALLDVVPVVTGRTCWPMRRETTRPIERDDDVVPPVFYAPDVWRLQSVPA